MCEHKPSLSSFCFKCFISISVVRSSSDFDICSCLMISSLFCNAACSFRTSMSKPCPISVANSMSVLRLPLPGTFDLRLVGVEFVTDVGSRILEVWLEKLIVGTGEDCSDFEIEANRLMYDKKCF